MKGRVEMECQRWEDERSRTPQQTNQVGQITTTTRSQTHSSEACLGFLSQQITCRFGERRLQACIAVQHVTALLKSRPPIYAFENRGLSRAGS